MRNNNSGGGQLWGPGFSSHSHQLGGIHLMEPPESSSLIRHISKLLTEKVHVPHDITEVQDVRGQAQLAISDKTV